MRSWHYSISPAYGIVDLTTARRANGYVIDANAKARAVAQMHQALLRAIAQGRVWHKQLIAGDMDLPTLASGAGVSERHIKRGLQAPGWHRT
jgi:hypothetical protein